MRVLSVVGARPQFVKCAVVSRLLRQRHAEILVHTGQHHDPGLSARFFEELSIPKPDVNLGIQGGPHGQMTGRMMEALEPVMQKERPDFVLVYGDTNSTVAAALVAAKLDLPVAHVEAGLRSFNRRMPEEINRIVTDHLSKLLLCPTAHAVDLLAREGLVEGVHNTGDVMFDSLLLNLERARRTLRLETVFSELGFAPTDPYAVATLHRAENTDEPARLGALLGGLSGLPVRVLLPLHPRTKKILDADATLAAQVGSRLCLVPPVGYLELLLIMSQAAAVLTDSGGVQKEAFFLGVPCLTLRDETEWVETVDAGANELVGADPARLSAAFARALVRGRLPPTSKSGAFGDGRAAEKIVACLENH